jgi:phage terminase large subunit-like protein
MKSKLIRMFPEDGRDSPFWGDAGELLSAEELGLSSDLRHRTAQWMRTWDSEFNLESRWSEPTTGRQWASDGHAIARLVESELGNSIRVLFDGQPW